MKTYVATDAIDHQFSHVTKVTKKVKTFDHGTYGEKDVEDYADVLKRVTIPKGGLVVAEELVSEKEKAPQGATLLPLAEIRNLCGQNPMNGKTLLVEQPEKAPAAAPATAPETAKATA